MHIYLHDDPRGAGERGGGRRGMGKEVRKDRRERDKERGMGA